MKHALSQLLLLITFTYTAYSQPFNLDQQIPVDSSIRIGTLANGLKYYIKRNSRPEKRMELRLAVNVGSIVEDKDQLGLAHFTEHMAFNGTTHFAKNELVSYLQTLGLRFGADLNAYTSFDETVFMLLLPTDKAETMDKGFLVLQDWAAGITFDSLEVEKERGVVLEEWRLGQGADQRMMDKNLPVIFYNSKYAKRLPIGTKESIETFNQKSIRRFYTDWYRPDMMAVIAVGDFNPDAMEAQIKEHFSTIAAPKNPRKREKIEVPPHKETLVTIASDKEANMTTVNLFYKMPRTEDKSIRYYRGNTIQQLFFSMLNQRLNELTRSADPPFINSYCFKGIIGARTNESYVCAAITSEDGIEKGLKSLLIENERIRQHGFTQSELDRAKLEILTLYERYFNERDKSESEQFASEFVRNFLTGESIPGIAFEYKFVNYMVPQITLSDVNKVAPGWLDNSSCVIAISTPEKEGLKLPVEKELRALAEAVTNQKTEAYKDNLTVEKLMDAEPVAGSIAKASTDTVLGITQWTLSNGAHVVLKPTEFKNDEVLLSAISLGGQSLCADSDHFSAAFAVQVIQESGVGNFNAVDLEKLLAGKNVNVSPVFGNFSEGIKASAMPKDLETMFELVYLYFTHPRVDTDAFKSWSSRMKAYLHNVATDPDVYYSDQVTRTLTQNHKRGGGVPFESDVDQIKPMRVQKIITERFADASDFTFTIVGSFRPDSVKLLIEKYIASMPSGNTHEKNRDLGIRPPKGLVVKDVYKGSDDRSRVTLMITDTLTYNAQKAYYLESLADLLDIRLIEVLREEKSGVYGVGASASLNRLPYNNYNISIRYPCSPSNVDSLEAEALKIITEIKQKGVSETNLTKIKETQLRELEVSMKTNRYWLTSIENAMFYNENLSELGKKKRQIEQLTSEAIKAIANECIRDNYIKIVLLPEKK